MNENSIENSQDRPKIPILLLKTKSSPNDGYGGYFSTIAGNEKKWRFEPTFVPVLEHRFQKENLSRFDDLLRKKQISRNAGAAYGGLIFTSQRAVEAFTKLVENGRGMISHLIFDQ